MKYKSYPKYKDSGIEWLGEIPEEWRVLKIRHLGRLSTSSVNKKIKEGEKIVNLVNFMDVYANLKKEIGANIEFMKVSASDEQIIKNDLQKGDVLFMPSSETVDEIGFSAVVVDNLPNTLYSYHVLRLRFIEDVDIRYKKYIFNNHLILNKFSSKAVGTTRMILGLSDFKDTFAQIPSKAEQIKIANYLDKKTEKINTVIEKNKKQIDLLKERRQAIISQAITKGLDPRAKMKDSGIEWLGEIPERWQISKMKYLISRNDGGIWGEEFDDNGTIVLRSTEISIDGTWNIQDPAMRRISDQEKSKSFLKEGDLLITKSSGSKLHIGKTALVTKKIEQLNCCFSNFMQRLRPKDEMLPKLLFYFLNSYIARTV